MKQHLDEAMKERGIDWIILSGPRSSNPDIVYFIGEANILNPVLVKKRDEELIVIHNSMERGEVERCGLRGLDTEEIVSRREMKNIQNEVERWMAFYGNLIKHLRIGGNVAFYGIDYIQRSFFIYREILKRYPHIALVQDVDDNILQAIRQTKDDGELEVLRDMTRRTCVIIKALIDYLRSKQLRGTMLVHRNGRAVTVGDLRKRAFMEMAKGAMNAADPPIISLGRDSAIPHSIGDDSVAIEAGKPLILDIFPRCTRKGYISDLTRTVCIGPAPPRLKELYQAVLEAQGVGLASIRPGVPVSSADEKVSAFFEGRGFPTLSRNPLSRDGYVHSLGHGIGLDLHEKPRVSVFNYKSHERFLPGMVFTVEPGLYFPGEEMGVRIEDVVALHGDSTLEVLSDLPRELEIFPEG
ncbi:MAG: Xaa-Pro peptidase family protein [Candidatus Eremiobacteraeota bacterium]|nr:Xaa-Pro peptidase family protein [Candidatus Eremiobacteraeota bacterium]